MGTVKRGGVGWDRIAEESILHCQDSHVPHAPVSGSSLLLCSALLPPPHSLIPGRQPMCANLTTRSLLTLCASVPSGFPEKNFLVVLIRLVVRAAVLSSMGLKFLCKRQHPPPHPHPPKNLENSMTEATHKRAHACHPVHAERPETQIQKADLRLLRAEGGE